MDFDTGSSILILIAGLSVALVSWMAGSSIGYKRGINASYKKQFPASPLPIYIFKAVSAVCLILSIGSVVYSSYFLSNSMQTTAIVTEIAEHTDSEDHKTFTSLYTYKDHLNQNHTSSSNSGDGRGTPIGHKLNIRYIEKHPHRSQVDTFAAAWSLPIIFALLSLITSLISHGLKIKRNHEIAHNITEETPVKITH